MEPRVPHPRDVSVFVARVGYHEPSVPHRNMGRKPTPQLRKENTGNPAKTPSPHYASPPAPYSGLGFATNRGVPASSANRHPVR